MEFVTNEKLTIVGAAGMIGSNMAQTAIMMGLTPNICLSIYTTYYKIGDYVDYYYGTLLTNTSQLYLFGSRPSRSILLMKMITGVFLMRHTSMSLRVCASTPLAESTTMMAESTAVSVR